MQPELRQLRAFLAVADQGSANRAGVALFRLHSAVSRSIHKLEDELGARLFERRTRGMLLTESGRALLVRAQRVRTEMQRARADVAALVDRDRVRNAPIFGIWRPSGACARSSPSPSSITCRRRPGASASRGPP